MAQYLYQQIMDVPGLTGSWKDRLAQYYKNLTGNTYQGTKDEGLYMLAQIAKGNYAQPTTTTTTTTPTSTSLADQYASTGVTAGTSASATPQFESVLPFYDAWNQMVPQATAAAESQINPEVMRNYNLQNEGLMANLASTGGYRMGRGFDSTGASTGLSSLGALKASTERDRQSQLQDWLNAYQTGYKDLFYTPSETAWNNAITQGTTPDSTLTTIPTWDEVYNTYNTSNNSGSSSTSPLYG